MDIETKRTIQIGLTNIKDGFMEGLRVIPWPGYLVAFFVGVVFAVALSGAHPIVMSEDLPPGLECTFDNYAEIYLCEL